MVKDRQKTSNHFETEKALDKMVEWGVILNNLPQNQPSMGASGF